MWRLPGDTGNSSARRFITEHMALLRRVARGAAMVAGLVAVGALRPPGAVHLAGTASRPAAALVLSDQARRYLELQWRSYSTEFMGCMIGDVSAATVVVRRIAPADVDPAQSARTHVLPRGTCEAAGWAGTVGIIHSHPGGERCFYYFPGTQVPSSDARSFAMQGYPVDAIMCGDSVVWIGRDQQEHPVPLSAGPTASAPVLEPGNRVREGSAPASQRP